MTWKSWLQANRLIGWYTINPRRRLILPHIIIIQWHMLSLFFTLTQGVDYLVSLYTSLWLCGVESAERRGTLLGVISESLFWFTLPLTSGIKSHKSLDGCKLSYNIHMTGGRGNTGVRRGILNSTELVDDYSSIQQLFILKWYIHNSICIIYCTAEHFFRNYFINYYSVFISLCIYLYLSPL